jgi:PAS domain S-box-containing protein
MSNSRHRAWAQSSPTFKGVALLESPWLDTRCRYDAALAANHVRTIASLTKRREATCLTSTLCCALMPLAFWALPKPYLVAALLICVVQIAFIAALVIQRTWLGLSMQDRDSRFRDVANAAPVMIWMSGNDKVYNYFSKKWLEFTGRSVEQEERDGWLEGVHPKDREKLVLDYSYSFDERVEFKIEFRLRRFDGQYRWVLNLGVPRFDARDQFVGYIGCCIDIEQRRAAEATVLEVSGQLITAQEEERAHTARELHDNLSQRMAMLEIGLQQLKGKPTELSHAAKKHLNDVEKIASEISSDIHQLSHRLHPSKLHNLGLVVALHGLCNEISKQSNVKIHFTYGPVPKDLPGDISLCLYRISQEALNNVVRHSSAREATLDLSRTNHTIGLCILDAGLGFNPERVQEKAGLGLVSMRERLRLVGGQLSIASAPFHGTRVCAQVPLPDRSLPEENGSTSHVHAAEDREVPHG